MNKYSHFLSYLNTDVYIYIYIGLKFLLVYNVLLSPLFQPVALSPPPGDQVQQLVNDPILSDAVQSQGVNGKLETKVVVHIPSPTFIKLDRLDL